MTASFLATYAPLGSVFRARGWSPHGLSSRLFTCPPAEISTREGPWGREEMRVTSHMTDITPAGVIRRRAGRSYADGMVNLTRIYTRTGDQGTTALGDMSRTAKTDLRISAYADTNEANAVIGTAIALGQLSEDVVKVLVRVQNDLFDVGADLSTPVVEDPKYPPLRVEQSYVDKLEADCDRFLAELEDRKSVV